MWPVIEFPAAVQTDKPDSSCRGSGAPGRELIVNADDFGMSASVNRGIIIALEQGVATSASLMVRREAAPDAAAYARRHGSVSVGLHVDLGEWILRASQWEPLYIVVPLNDSAAVAHEVARQLDIFRDIMGDTPTHLDSHQHVHRKDPVRSIMIEMAGALGVPLRHFTKAIRYCGRFYGQRKSGEIDDDAIGVPRLIKIVRELDSGVTELCCHPGDEIQPGEQYGASRPKELATLCSAQVRTALTEEAVRLRSFHGAPAALALAD
jgi:predicted glycoside hydrolase/deacetylase ChbG (UPF0249 family)